MTLAKPVLLILFAIGCAMHGSTVIAQDQQPNPDQGVSQTPVLAPAQTQDTDEPAAASPSDLLIQEDAATDQSVLSPPVQEGAAPNPNVAPPAPGDAVQAPFANPGQVPSVTTGGGCCCDACCTPCCRRGNWRAHRRPLRIRHRGRGSLCCPIATWQFRYLPQRGNR